MTKRSTYTYTSPSLGRRAVGDYFPSIRNAFYSPARFSRSRVCPSLLGGRPDSYVSTRRRRLNRRDWTSRRVKYELVETPPRRTDICDAPSINSFGLSACPKYERISPRGLVVRRRGFTKTFRNFAVRSRKKLFWKIVDEKCMVRTGYRRDSPLLNSERTVKINVAHVVGTKNRWRIKRHEFRKKKNISYRLTKKLF